MNNMIKDLRSISNLHWNTLFMQVAEFMVIKIKNSGYENPITTEKMSHARAFRHVDITPVRTYYIFFSKRGCEKRPEPIAFVRMCGVGRRLGEEASQQVEEEELSIFWQSWLHDRILKFPKFSIAVFTSADPSATVCIFNSTKVHLRL